MKIPIKYIFAFGTVLSVVSVHGQGSGSYEPSAPGPARVENLRSQSNFVVTRTVSGMIVRLNEGVLTVKTEKDIEVGVGVVLATKFKIGKKIVKGDELSDDLFLPGTPVKIVYVPLEDKRVDKVALEIGWLNDGNKKKPSLVKTGV